MGYRIEYGSDKRYRTEKANGVRIFWLTGTFLLLFGLLTAKYWPKGRDLLEDVVFPGDAAVTKQAFSVMTEQLRQGETIGDAVAAFCREVIDGAALTD